MMPAEVRSCIEGADLAPVAKRYEIDFLFDGRSYHVSPASRAALRDYLEYKH